MIHPPFAVLSDLHANLEATEAVLGDIDRRGLRAVACLGDIVGYGPDPVPVLDAIRRRAEVVVCGNHDWAVLHEEFGFQFSFVAQAALEFTREALRPPPHETTSRSRARLRFLDELPVTVTKGEWQFVHGTLRRPLTEYCFGDRQSMFDPDQLAALFPLVKRICFAGHTHVPVVIRDDHACWYPSDDEPEFRFESGRKYIVNAGSVGQPRDRDPRACYAIFVGDAVRYVRVPYDVQRTRKKIIEMPELANRLGDRLVEGR
jgi:predicted phosphodiesterase